MADLIYECADASTLPVDAIRRVLSLLDWRALATCQAVCRSWRTLAADEQLWQQHVSSEFFRFGLLTYAAAVLPAGWKEAGASNTSAAAAARSVLALPAPASNAATASSSSSTPGVLKSIFSAGLLHAAAPHQAHLSRFHTAVLQVTGWRLVLKKAHTSSAEPAAAAAATDANAKATADADTSAGGGEHAAGIGELSLSNPNPDAGPSSSSSDAATAADGLAPSPASGSSSSSSSQAPVSGHPAPLTLQALQSGGWACGCILSQQQEQSCWLRFHLPPELKTDEQVATLVQEGQMSAIVQGLGPAGWFEVATADPFLLAAEETEILMQSHKTGFYAWDQAGEDGDDRYGQIQPLPWDLNPGQHQADQAQAPQEDQDQQQQHVSADTATAHQQAFEQQQQQQQGNLPQQQQGQPQQQGQGGQQQPAAAPQLRMLVYVHYEQLLQVLPWTLPHTLPLPAAPVLQTPTDFARHLLCGPAALWLQLDVCQLYGGHRLGTCVVPLVLWGWDSAKAKFRCVEDQLLVLLHKQDRSLGCDVGEGRSAVGEEAAAGQGASGVTVQQHQQSAARSGSMQAAAAATAAGATESMIKGMLGSDAWQQMLLGTECMYGADSSSTRDGNIVRTAADALRELMGTDEIMIDFALFDVNGHLLMGRAGIEVWSKEASDTGCIQQGVCRAGDTLAAAQQPQPVLTPADGAGSSGGNGQAQPGLQPPAAAAADGSDSTLAACIASNGGFQRRWRTPGEARRALERMMTREHLRLSMDELAEMESVQEAERASAAPTVPFNRTQHKLYFLVDGLPADRELFWHNCITVDAERPPDGWVRYGEALGPVSTVSLQLSWGNLRALFGLPAFD